MQMSKSFHCGDVWHGFYTRIWSQDYPPLLAIHQTARCHNPEGKSHVDASLLFRSSHTAIHRVSLLNNDENMYLGDTLLVPKLRNGLRTSFFKIIGLDEALKNEYSCLWDVTRCRLVEIQRLILKTSVNCNTPHVVTSHINEINIICWYIYIYTKRPQWQDLCCAQEM